MFRIRAVKSKCDPRVTEACDICVKAPTLSAKQAMMVAGISQEDAQSLTKQMWVRHRTGSTKALWNGDLSMFTTPNQDHVSPDTDVLKNISAPTSNCKGSTQAQQVSIAKKAKNDYEKKAHKAATLLYAKESKKANGISASEDSS